MIESVIQNVLLAEQKASQIKQSADEYAVSAIEKATATAEEIKRQSLETAKVTRAEILKNANAQAEKEYADAIKKANENALQTVNGLQNDIEKIANELVKGVLDGSC